MSFGADAAPPKPTMFRRARAPARRPASTSLLRARPHAVPQAHRAGRSRCDPARGPRLRLLGDAAARLLARGLHSTTSRSSPTTIGYRASWPPGVGVALIASSRLPPCATTSIAHSGATRRAPSSRRARERYRSRHDGDARDPPGRRRRYRPRRPISPSRVSRAASRLAGRDRDLHRISALATHGLVNLGGLPGRGGPRRCSTRDAAIPRATTIRALPCARCSSRSPSTARRYGLEYVPTARSRSLAATETSSASLLYSRPRRRVVALDPFYYSYRGRALAGARIVVCRCGRRHGSSIPPSWPLP